MNVILFPNQICCEGCGCFMAMRPMEGEWDPEIKHVLFVCGNQNCLRGGKVLKFPLARVYCTPAIAGSEKAKPAIVLPN